MYCENALSLLADPRVESLNPGRVNKINGVSKFSIICKSFTLHIGPAHGHIKIEGVLKKSLKMLAQAIRRPYQSYYLEILPHFYVKNIFLAQNLTKWQGFNKSHRKSMKIYFQFLKKSIKTYSWNAIISLTSN